MKKTVVLIDDDEDDLGVVEEIIKEIDNDVLCIRFLCPDEALRILCKEIQFVPNYIFIDINMPRLSGYEVLNEMRKKAELESTVITMLSTSMPKTVSNTLLEQGANFAFEKPVNVVPYRQIFEQVFSFELS